MMKSDQPGYLVTFVLGLSLLTSVATAQSLGRAPSPAARQATHRPQGFTDYALGKINSGSHDFGTDLRSARGLFVGYTVDDAYFWSNCISLGLLIAVTACFLLQLRSGDKKEGIAATLVAQMWNGRVSDKIEIDKRTAAYNTLVDQHNEMVEKKLSGKLAAGSKGDSEIQTHQVDSDSMLQSNEIKIRDTQAAITTQPVAAIAKRKEQLTEKPVPPATVVEVLDSNTAQRPVPSIGEIAGDPVALKQEVIRLRAQLSAFKNRENNLLVRLNAAEEYRKQRDSNTVSH